jgi:hypothetical protein
VWPCCRVAAGNFLTGEAHDLAQGRAPQLQRKRCVSPPGYRYYHPELSSSLVFIRQICARKTHERQGAAEDTKAGQLLQSHTSIIQPLPPLQPASMFFSANNALGPPYHILLDTNFINFRQAACARALAMQIPAITLVQHPKQVRCNASRHGLLVRQMHNIHQVRLSNITKSRFNSKRPTPHQSLARRASLPNYDRPQLAFPPSDCVMAELEKLGSKYKVALRIARDARFERLPCQHKGTCVTRHASHVTRHTSHVTRHTSHVTRHTSHVTRHTSHVTRYTLHVTCHTSHVTRHTSHVTQPV